VLPLRKISSILEDPGKDGDRVLAPDNGCLNTLHKKIRAGFFFFNLTGFMIFSIIDHGRRQQQQQLIKPITYLQQVWKFLRAATELLAGHNRREIMAPTRCVCATVLSSFCRT
jgi:hypothetical protein